MQGIMKRIPANKQVKFEESISGYLRKLDVVDSFGINVVVKQTPSKQ